jgi:hypothetical protein
VEQDREVPRPEEEIDKQWGLALAVPKQFGKLMGMMAVLGEPEPLEAVLRPEREEVDYNRVERCFRRIDGRRSPTPHST